MRHPSTQITAALLSSFIFATASKAQNGVLAKWSTIHPRIEMKGVGEISGETIPLKWSCGPESTTTATLALGTPIVLQAEVNGQRVQVPSIVTTAEPKRIHKDVPVDSAIAAFRGTVFIDKNQPSRLRVNPYLWQELPAALKCPPLTGATAARSSADELRDVEFFYDLKNRQTVSFRTTSIGFSGVTVPIRYRPPYTAANGAHIKSDVADAISLGALFGATFSKTRYQFVRNSDNTLAESSRFTIGLFSTVAKGTVEAKTSRSAKDTVSGSSSFPTLSVGLAALTEWRSVGLGVFAAPEIAFGSSDARSWDYDRRWWFGIGLSFNSGK